MGTVNPLTDPVYEYALHFDRRGQYPREPLPGRKETRVFIGGQYDFMPTLLAIRDYVIEVNRAEHLTFCPIISYFFYDEPRADTIDWDVNFLSQCSFAIFDLSDLGAQLIEMTHIRNAPKIKRLMVYPIRRGEDRDMPERGKRTVESFGIARFGYSTFDELRSIVRHFLVGVPKRHPYLSRPVSEEDFAPKICELRRLRANEKLAEAEKFGKRELLKNFSDRIDTHLELALVYGRLKKPLKCRHHLNEARKLYNASTKNPLDLAELLYYKAISQLEASKLGNAESSLEEAKGLGQEDPRVLGMLGYIHWRRSKRKLPELQQAIALTEEALKKKFDEPTLQMTLMNNLGYYYYDLARRSRDTEQKRSLAEKALNMTSDLEHYHRALDIQDGEWLDTRGRVLLLNAEIHGDRELWLKGKKLLTEAQNLSPGLVGDALQWADVIARKMRWRNVGGQ